MGRSFSLIIVLLALGLLVQNTCPHGFAGKTSLASSCGHCPLKQIQAAPSQAKQNIFSDASSLHFPFFVFSVPRTNPLAALESVDSGNPVPANTYDDASPQELLRPPQA